MFILVDDIFNLNMINIIMEFTNKKLAGIKTQNDSLYDFIVLNNPEFSITFERMNIDYNNFDENTIFETLKQENKSLKEIAEKYKQSKNNKKSNQTDVDGIIEKKLQLATELNNNDDNDKESFEDPIKKYDIICNMEDMKRAFFNINVENDENYLLFQQLLMTNNFHFYEVEYLYNSDNDGKPEYIAKNLLRGFVKQFDDYRKYFMIVFRCYKNSLDDENKSYKYNSYWIVNTNEPINNIIGSLYDDFKFIKIDNTSMLNNIIKVCIDENSLCLDEKYVH